jgi:aryl-phospho-beta-D-glucosidase BglC (GH1 family)
VAAIAVLLGVSFRMEAQTPSVSSWQTSGSQIVEPNGRPVRIAGLSWFGLETSNFAPHGLWTRSYREMMDQMRDLGYNTIRLPFSSQLFDSQSIPNGIDYTKNPDLKGLNGLQIMDLIIAYAGEAGLRIVLDRHRINANAQSVLWYDESYPESRWISDWLMLAARYKDNPTVVGMDLHNEPGGDACWGCGDKLLDWRLAAQRAGNAILAVNPNVLIIVQGIETYKGNSYWRGGNLRGAGDYPVTLAPANHLVYSTHDYPASVHSQSWFSDKNYPGNLPSVWDVNWGYLQKQRIAPVLVGEFGSKLQTTSDQQWFDAMIRYLGSGATGFGWLFWSWNPNSTDTGGLLQDDWTTVDTRKQSKLSTIQFTPDALWIRPPRFCAERPGGCLPRPIER